MSETLRHSPRSLHRDARGNYLELVHDVKKLKIDNFYLSLSYRSCFWTFFYICCWINPWMADSGSFWFSLKFILLFFSPSILIFDIILIHYFVEFRSVFFFFFVKWAKFLSSKIFCNCNENNYKMRTVILEMVNW